MAVTAPRPSRPAAVPSALRWLRENLFNSPANAALTVVTLAVIALVLRGALTWAFTEARWAVVPANFRLMMAGPYPESQMWRLWSIVVAFAALAGAQWGATSGAAAPRAGFAGLAAIALFTLVTQRGSSSGVLVPVAAVACAAGFFAGRVARGARAWLVILWAALLVASIVLVGADLGGGGVPATMWGGLLLTMMLSVVAILASFPLGVLLAIGRASRLPVVSLLCVAYIELVRGIPLVVVLFMAQLFVPLFLGGLEVPAIIRAMTGLTLFTAAYLAEYVRGGLQAVPRGQVEAARALGLNGTFTLGLIVLPQALRAVIPGIVGQFISLFKDTSLVAIIGLTDLLRIGATITANPEWIGRYREVYLAVAAIYFVFSYAMSLGSRRLEARLGVGRR